MRIIGGKYKGYTILSQKSLQIKPTSDRARESIFNVLQHSLTTDKQDHVVEDSNVLDLCCGTGALGLEAISRGAKSVLFVDNSPNSSKIVRKNIEKFKIKKNCTVKCQNATQIKSIKNSFSLFFIDPPYRMEIVGKILESLDKQKILKENAIGVIELGKKRVFDLVDNFLLIKKTTISSSQFLFVKYRKKKINLELDIS